MSRNRLLAAAAAGLMLLAACGMAGQSETGAPPVEQAQATAAAIPTQTAQSAAAPAPTNTLAETLPTLTPAASVTQIPDPNGFEWRSVAAGFNRLVDLADLGDGSGWAWALEQDGRIRAVNL